MLGDNIVYMYETFKNLLKNCPKKIIKGAFKEYLPELLEKYLSNIIYLNNEDIKLAAKKIKKN